MEIIRNNPCLAVLEMSELLGVSQKTAKRDMNKLVESGIIQHVGSNKSGCWEIVKNDPINGFQSDPINDPINVPQITPRQKKILEIIRNNPCLAVLEMSELLGVSQKTAKRDMNKLVESGIIQHVGSNKSGCWEIVKSDPINDPISDPINGSSIGLSE